MESWRLVLQQGFLPQWDVPTLKRLLKALEEDDRRITQGSTTTPPPLMCVQDWTCEGCCPVSFCGVEDPFNSTVGEVEEGFAKACFTADQTLGEPAACRWLLHQIDDAPRHEIFADLTAELRSEIERRSNDK